MSFQRCTSSKSRKSRERKYLDAACRALDFALPMLVADGGDAWETPMKAPNLLATGHAAIAYELAYRATGKQTYRKKALYWIRGLLIFTKLWEPKKQHQLYNTKPCFCVTDWATTSWVDARFFACRRAAAGYRPRAR